MIKKIKTIYTIGHSNRTIDEFVEILKNFGIKKVVDVRTIPKSRHNPQFNMDELKKSLVKNGLRYEHLEELGGFRHTKKDSINLGWINASFRGFADYMQSEEFKKGLSSLEKIGERETTAIMCAEAVPWRCHRSLIGDALIVHKWKVLDIFNKKNVREHKRTNFLRVRSGNLTYPKLSS